MCAPLSPTLRRRLSAAGARGAKNAPARDRVAGGRWRRATRSCATTDRPHARRSGAAWTATAGSAGQPTSQSALAEAARARRQLNAPTMVANDRRLLADVRPPPAPDASSPGKPTPPWSRCLGAHRPVGGEHHQCARATDHDAVGAEGVQLLAQRLMEHEISHDPTQQLATTTTRAPRARGPATRLGEQGGTRRAADRLDHRPECVSCNVGPSAGRPTRVHVRHAVGVHA